MPIATRPAKSPKHAARNARERAKRERAKRVEETRMRMRRDPHYGVPPEHEPILIAEAVASLVSGAGRAGRRSAVYRMPREVLHEIAMRAVLRGEAGEAICREHAPSLLRHRVPHKAAVRWLTEVRLAYNAARYKRIDAILATKDAAKYAANPEAMLSDILCAAGPKIVKAIEMFDPLEASNYERTNFIRTVTDAIAEIPTHGKRRAETAKIMRQIALLGEEAREGKRTAAEVGRMIEALVRGEDPKAAGGEA